MFDRKESAYVQWDGVRYIVRYTDGISTFILGEDHPGWVDIRCIIKAHRQGWWE